MNFDFHMDYENFLNLPTEEVAKIVRAGGSQVCVFPINGTRRWFMLEHPDQNNAKSYLSITWQRHIELYKLIFDHGFDTLLTPIFGPDLLERGESYRQLIEPGMLWLAQNQGMLDFYDEYDVRVRIYGDVRQYFINTPYEHILDVFDEITRRTSSHHRHRLFFGICAHDAAETVARNAISFYQEHGGAPNKRQIVEAYYGEYIGPVSLFIGFDRPTVFDMPLIAIGNEDLYFTASPSLYLDAHTLRKILYDHLYSRRVSEAYTDLSPEERTSMADFYSLNRHQVLGIGHVQTNRHFWYPLPEITLPHDW